MGPWPDPCPITEMSPHSGCHLPRSLSDTPDVLMDEFIGVQELPSEPSENRKRSRDPLFSESLDIEDSEEMFSVPEILKVKDEDQLYAIIRGAVSYLVEFDIGTPDFVREVINSTNGIMTLASFDGVHRNQSIEVLRISERMARDPYLIAEALIHIMSRWYVHQEIMNPLCAPEFREASECFKDLIETLDEMERDPHLRGFRKLYKYLNRVFPIPASKTDLTSEHALFYFWAYYNEYVLFIGNETLKVIGFLGEGMALCQPLSYDSNQSVSERMFMT